MSDTTVCIEEALRAVFERLKTEVEKAEVKALRYARDAEVPAYDEGARRCHARVAAYLRALAERVSDAPLALASGDVLRAAAAELLMAAEVIAKGGA